MKGLIYTTLLALAVFSIAGSAAAQVLSTSIMRPTPIDPETGRIAHNFPGGEGPTSYYFTIELQAGDLMTQLEVSGRPNVPKRVDFELLNANARIADSAYVMAELEAKRDVTKTYPIDTAGRYVVRLLVEGSETNSFCVLMGGTALPDVKSPGCPAPVAARKPVSPPARAAAEPRPEPVVAKPVTSQAETVTPPQKPPLVSSAVEVITSACEERLRVGSDFLFDFDRAVVRSEASKALAELAARIKAAEKAVMIEGHTDSKGTDSYNQGLSERRAEAVRADLVRRGLPDEWLWTSGFGKNQPAVPNQHADGSDDPAGRQKNRRVEVVINTCS